MSSDQADDDVTLQSEVQDVSQSSPGLPETRLYRMSSVLSGFKEANTSRPPKGMNENRQLEYIAQLSLQRRKEVCAVCQMY